MEGDFSIAWEALRALRDRGVSPADVWEVLGSDRRLSRQVGAATGRCLMGSAESSDPMDLDAIDHLERLADPTSMVVPRPKSGPSVVISVRLPVAVAEQLMQVSDRTGTGHTVLAARYIAAGLMGQSGEPAIPISALQRAIADLAQQVAPPAA